MRQTFQASILLAGIAQVALAQPVVAPTPDTVGSTRGENWNDYNITNSFETGYRFADIFGNRGKYRSDENYRNGVRLLGSQFSANSKTATVDCSTRSFSIRRASAATPMNPPFCAFRKTSCIATT